MPGPGHQPCRGQFPWVLLKPFTIKWSTKKVWTSCTEQTLLRHMYWLSSKANTGKGIAHPRWTLLQDSRWGVAPPLAVTVELRQELFIHLPGKTCTKILLWRQELKPWPAMSFPYLFYFLKIPRWGGAPPSATAVKLCRALLMCARSHASYW